MAERCVRTAPSNRGVEKALVALKKGAHLLKCRRRGKPKFCPFRLSSDEKVLIWYSGEKEKQLKLSSVSKTVFGQKTVNFLSQPHPGKESQSFSLIYLNGEKSLDLICKDKEQAETWFLGLTALLYWSRHPRPVANLRNHGDVQSCINSPVGCARRSNTLGLLQEPPKFLKVHNPYGSPAQSILQRYISDRVLDSPDAVHSSRKKSLSDMQLIVDKLVPQPPLMVPQNFKDIRDFNLVKKQIMYNSNIQLIDNDSSAMDTTDVLKDVFMWGEGIGGIFVCGSTGIDPDELSNDSLLPKLMESTRVLDVTNIACGQRHGALVTKQGEVFSWGEENGGRLGHKVNMDVPFPKAVESLNNVFIQSVACGALHTCALTSSGELYAWGDITHGIGLSCDGRSRSQWFPQKISGPLDGIHISRVACGEWHTALVSASGQLFTYGDGTFGALGHGNLQCVLEPKEVESFTGLWVKSVACGPWHTAAIVEVMGSFLKNNGVGGKLFTWGDSDKGKLGHVDTERKVFPACVESLVDCDFLQVSCGRILTVALTVTGMVFTMGSAANGQLGNPRAENGSVASVGGLLKAEFVKEISSGSFHVAALTTKGKVYTWGKGANGRLGLGDVNDRNSPALVGSLEGRYVRSIACGSSFTAAVCSHKYMSGKDQSICSGCKMDFGFTRKKHNCYNCGFAFCHSCSSKKAMNASLAPNKSKQSRVCDPCFVQLRARLQSDVSTKIASPRLKFLTRKGLSESKAIGQEMFPMRTNIFSRKGSDETIKSIEETKVSIQVNNHQNQGPAPLFKGRMQRWGQVSCPPLFSGYTRVVPLSKEAVSYVSHSYTWEMPADTRYLPPNATCLKQDLTVLDKMLAEELKHLHTKGKFFQQQCQNRSQELQHCKRRIEETWSFAKDEAAKCKAAKDVIKVLTNQMNALLEKIPTGRPVNSTRSVADVVYGRSPHLQTELLAPSDSKSNVASSSFLSCDTGTGKDRQNGRSFPRTIPALDWSAGTSGTFKNQHNKRSTDGTVMSKADRKPGNTNLLKDEWVEQDEVGVYMTLITLPSGQKGLKRIRFSRKHFSEKEAERWWKENQTRICSKHNIERIMTTTRSKTRQ